VGEPLALHAGAVDLHHVVPPHHGVQLAGSAVDADAARANELVRTSAGSDPGPGEIGVQAHRGIVARVLRP
jgi:hypothetical protein